MPIPRTLCSRCTLPATKLITLVSRSSGQVLMTEAVCEDHLAAEQRLQITGLSIPDLIVEPLSVDTL